ncbi:MAG: HAD family hydrolase [Thermoplasmata archaeon]
MRRIAAVTFDLWDTLIQEHPGGSVRVAELRCERIGAFLSSRGIVHSRDKIRQAYDETGSFLELTWSKRRDMPVRDHVLFMLNSMDNKLPTKLSKEDIARVEKIYVEGLLDNPPMLLPGARDALRRVRGLGYRIGLISNTGRTPGAVLRVLMNNMGILEFFDTTTFSNEILVRKPSPEAFRVTLDKLKAPPRAAVHIGDDSEGDVAGAKKAGMRAIQIVANGDTVSSLADDYAESLAQAVERIERL